MKKYYHSSQASIKLGKKAIVFHRIPKLFFFILQEKRHCHRRDTFSKKTLWLLESNSDQFKLTKSVKVWVLNPYFIRNVIKSSEEKKCPPHGQKRCCPIRKGRQDLKKKNQMGRFSFFLFRFNGSLNLLIKFFFEVLKDQKHHWPHHHAESVLNRRFLEPLSSSSTCLARKELFGRRSITSNHGAKSTLDKAVPIKMHMIFIDSPCMATSKYTKPIWNMEWHEKKMSESQ